MRFILFVTRALIGAATTSHITALKGQVRLGDRRYEKAMRRTDNATIALRTALDVAAEAKTIRGETKKAEEAERRANIALRAAANAEASSLRRGVTI